MNALKMLEQVKLLGYKEEKFVLSDSIELTLKTLSAKEDTEVYDELEDLKKGTRFVGLYKIKILARSIIQLNDIRFDISGADDEKIEEYRKEQLDKKEQIIASWSQPVVDDLFEKYGKLLGSANAFLKQKKP